MPRFSTLLFAIFSLLASLLVHAAPLVDIAYGPAPEQRYDLYPAASGERSPVILMVHGGGWYRGDKDMGRVVDNKQAHWVPKGIALASTNYRMQPKAPPLEQARDVARALADLQAKAAEFRVDRDNIVLMGHSAGAHLIALLAARPELLAEAGARPPKAYVVLDSGALDVPEIMNARHFRLYDRAFGSNPADWTAASPYHHLRQATAPMMIVCSSRRSDACPQGRNFAAKAQSLGSRVEVLPLDMTHGAINYELGKEADYTAKVESFLASASPAFAERLGR